MMGAFERRAYAAFFLSIAALTAWWGLDRTVPVSTQIVASASVVAGSDALLLTSVVRHRLCAASLSRSFFDAEGERTILPDLDFPAPGNIGPDRFRQRFPIPAHAAQGAGRIRFVLTFRCNPVHTVWPIGPDVVEIPVVVTPKAAP